MGRFSFILELLKPWPVKVLLFLFAAIQIYDAASNQFDWPKIPKLWGMAPSLKPWWAWLLAIIVFALFEFVRVSTGVLQRTKTSNVDAEDPHPNIALTELAKRIVDGWGTKHDGKNNAQKLQILNREIADNIKLKNATVWGRTGNRPLCVVDGYQWEEGTLDVSTNTLTVPTNWDPIKITDLYFSSDEVEKIWPASA